MVHVLFVCLGNICRSPMAEGVFKHHVRAAGLENQIESDSAGTGHWHIGSQPHRGTRAQLARNNIDYSHQARLITPSDLDTFDYVLTMDDQNLRDVQALGTGKAVVRPFLDYAPDNPVREVPDPYLVGGFEGVYDLVDEAAQGLLTAIRLEHSL
jgi:protein-tyrosine phosphatase